MEPLIKIVLIEPEIPHNTGNIIRLAQTLMLNYLYTTFRVYIRCKNLRRASLDYFDLSDVYVHDDFDDFLRENNSKIYLTDTKAKKNYVDCDFNSDDSYVFGSESSGINQSILDDFDEDSKIFIPVFPNVRSINICNSVSIIA